MRDDCTDMAAEVSFYFVLSLFPFFLLIAAIIGWLPSTNFWHSFVPWIMTYFPRMSRTILLAAILDLSKWHTAFLSFGLITTLWSASSGFVSLMEALSVAYGGKDTRSFWRKRAIAIGATIGAAIFFLLSFGLWTVGRWAERALTFDWQSVEVFQTPWRIAWWTFTLLLLSFGVDLVNYFLPDGERRWRWLSPGAIFVALSFTLASVGLDFYVRHNTMLPKVYGTLAGFIILMIWMYIATLILLIGAETNTAMAEMNRRRVYS